MKRIFLGILTGLVVLSVVAWRLKPAPMEGKTPLVWVSDDNPVRREQIEIFNRLHPKYQLALDPNNTGTQKIIVQSLAGIGPDIFDIYGRWSMYMFAEAGMVMDITDVARKRGFGLKDTWPEVRSTISIDGRQYGYPCNLCGTVLLYNKNVFDKYKVPYPPKGPWRWDDLVKIAKKLTHQKIDGSGFDSFGLIGADYYNLLIQNGASVYDKKGVYCVMDSPRAVEAIQFYYDLMFKYHVMPTPEDMVLMGGEGGWGAGTLKWFGSERVAMIYGARWQLITFRKYPDLRIGATHLPFKRVDTNLVNSRFAAVNKNSKHVEGALVFLKYLAGREYSMHLLECTDSMPGNPIYATEKNMDDPEHPEEDFNAIFPEAIRKGKPMEISRLINPFQAGRTIQRHLDLMNSKVKSAKQACRDITDEINRGIEKNLARFPKYRQTFKELTGKDWKPGIPLREQVGK